VDIWARETHPLITQEDVAKIHTEKLKLSFLLFDEIEKGQRRPYANCFWGCWIRPRSRWATTARGPLPNCHFSDFEPGGGEITELMQRRHGLCSA